MFPSPGIEIGSELELPDSKATIFEWSMDNHVATVIFNRDEYKSRQPYFSTTLADIFEAIQIPSQVGPSPGTRS